MGIITIVLPNQEAKQAADTSVTDNIINMYTFAQTIDINDNFNLLSFNNSIKGNVTSVRTHNQLQTLLQKI